MVDISTMLFEVGRITGSDISMFVIGSTNSSGGWTEKKCFVITYCRVKQSPQFCQELNKQANKQTNTTTVV